MRNIFATFAIAPLLVTVYVTAGNALPAIRFGVVPQQDAGKLVEPARIYCSNRETGEFLHWGPCETAAFSPPVPVLPRVQCRNRYTGAFDHWASGHCP